MKIISKNQSFAFSCELAKDATINLKKALDSIDCLRKRREKEYNIDQKIKGLKGVLFQSHFTCDGCELEGYFCEGSRCEKQSESIFNVPKKERSIMIRETFGSKFNNLSIRIKNQLRNEN